MSRANILLQFQYYVLFRFLFDVCSRNLVAFESLRDNVPKYSCGNICVFIWCGVIIWIGVTAVQTKTNA